MKKIFISHSNEDVKFVEKIVEMLENMGINHDEIFCTSLAGYGVPFGEDFLERIKTELLTDEIEVIFVLSKNFYASSTCMCEMGAAWVLSNVRRIPIIIPPFTYSDIKGVDLSFKIGLTVNDLSSWTSLYDEMCKRHNKEYKTTRWISKSSKTIEEIKQLLGDPLIESDAETTTTNQNRDKIECCFKIGDKVAIEGIKDSMVIQYIVGGANKEKHLEQKALKENYLIGYVLCIDNSHKEHWYNPSLLKKINNSVRATLVPSRFYNEIDNFENSLK